MANTNYTPYVTVKSNYAGTGHVRMLAVYNLTTTNFQMFTQKAAITQGNYWVLEGQGA